MDILIVSLKQEAGYTYLTASAGRHSASVCVGPQGTRVTVHNASNRAWRGMGRQFTDSLAALDNYKTPEVKRIIAHAAELYAAQGKA